MTNRLKTLIAFILFLAIFGIPLLFFLCELISSVFCSIRDSVNKRREEGKKQFVRTNSSLLKELNKINAGQSFLEIKKIYSFDYDLKSKREFDSFDPYDAFCNLCYRKSTEFRELAMKTLENRKKLDVYEKTVNQLIQRLDKEGLGQQYFEAELAVINECKLTPVVNPQISILYEYKTPKEKKIYHRSEEYGIDEIEKAIKHKRDIYSANAKYRATVQHERSLMTDKLRYQVLQRDGFRCCICGASSADGVKLHVDHIKPVSKGGKTELSNLRTLCDRCNLGKGSSYYEGGIN